MRVSESRAKPRLSYAEREQSQDRDSGIKLISFEHEFHELNEL